MDRSDVSCHSASAASTQFEYAAPAVAAAPLLAGAWSVVDARLASDSAALVPLLLLEAPRDAGFAQVRSAAACDLSVAQPLGDQSVLAFQIP